jgi:hypothetical protein
MVAVATITDAQKDIFGIKEEGGPAVVHDRRQDRDVAADMMAKEMAYATRRALLNRQQSVIVVILVVVIVIVVAIVVDDGGGGDDH